MILAALAAATALTAASALAAAPVATDAPASSHFSLPKDLDTNGDGFVSKDEWRARGDKMFEEMDANHDGKISADEMKAHSEAKRAEWLKNHPRVGTAAAAKLQQGAAPAAPAKQ